MALRRKSRKFGNRGETGSDWTNPTLVDTPGLQEKRGLSLYSAADEVLRD